MTLYCEIRRGINEYVIAYLLFSGLESTSDMVVVEVMWAVCVTCACKCNLGGRFRDTSLQRNERSDRARRTSEIGALALDTGTPNLSCERHHNRTASLLQRTDLGGD